VRLIVAYIVFAILVALILQIKHELFEPEESTNVSRRTSLCLGIFMLLFGFQGIRGFEAVWLNTLMFLAAYITGILSLLDAIRRNPR
jgi:hypothetical protein